MTTIFSVSIPEIVLVWKVFHFYQVTKQDSLMLDF